MNECMKFVDNKHVWPPCPSCFVRFVIPQTTAARTSKIVSSLSTALDLSKIQPLSVGSSQVQRLAAELLELPVPYPACVCHWLPRSVRFLWLDLRSDADPLPSAKAATTCFCTHCGCCRDPQALQWIWDKKSRLAWLMCSPRDHAHHEGQNWRC